MSRLPSAMSRLPGKERREEGRKGREEGRTEDQYRPTPVRTNLGKCDCGRRPLQCWREGAGALRGEEKKLGRRGTHFGRLSIEGAKTHNHVFPS